MRTFGAFLIALLLTVADAETRRRGYGGGRGRGYESGGGLSGLFAAILGFGFLVLVVVAFGLIGAAFVTIWDWLKHRLGMD